MTPPTASKLSSEEIDARLADPRLDDILARLDAPGGYDGFIEAVKASGLLPAAVAPGGSSHSHSGGHATVTFDTRDLPDRVLLKACGSRRETLCPPCSAVYRADAFQLVAAGFVVAKESTSPWPTIRLSSSPSPPRASVWCIGEARTEGVIPGNAGVDTVCRSDVPSATVRAIGSSARRSAWSATTTRAQCSST